MLRDSEVQGIRNATYQILMADTRLCDDEAELVLTRISVGEFTEAFSMIRGATPFWNLAAKRRITKAIRRLLVPEYMTDLIAIRRLAGLLEEGFCMRRDYVVWDETSDLISTMNWLMDHDKINYSLWRRFLHCTGIAATTS